MSVVDTSPRSPGIDDPLRTPETRGAAPPCSMMSTHLEPVRHGVVALEVIVADQLGPLFDLPAHASVGVEL